MRVRSNIPASFLYGLSWMLLCLTALMVCLAIGAQLGLATLPATTLTDLIGAAICSVLAFLCRSLARKFDQMAQRDEGHGDVGSAWVLESFGWPEQRRLCERVPVTARPPNPHRENIEILSRRSLLSGLLTVALAASFSPLTSTDTHAQPSRPVRRPPPPRRRFERRPPPRSGFVWVPGRWVWSARRGRWVWVSGRWVRRRTVRR
jgi:hypothetical protein